MIYLSYLIDSYFDMLRRLTRLSGNDLCGIYVGKKYIYPQNLTLSNALELGCYSHGGFYGKDILKT